MSTDIFFMKHCLNLAEKGLGNVAPNPMVGCVVVRDGKIIGEGYHEKYGEAHAEVNAIRSVKNRELLKESTLYVTLEPCAHHGKTPPCSDLIIEKQIPKVVVGTVDPFAEVAGRGIKKMQKAGIEVEVGILENECRELNKRFFTFHRKHRPFIILKWAQTQDGFIDIDRKAENFGEPTWITGPAALLRVHQMRAAENAIMVGTNTAEKDNPALTVRYCKGKNPLRIVIDRDLRLSRELKLFNSESETIVINSLRNEQKENIGFTRVDFSQNILPQILDILYQKEKLSLIVEGGRTLLQSFIDQGFWDEAYVYTGAKVFKSGIMSPKLMGNSFFREMIDEDILDIYKNPDQGS